ncbi:oligopeptide transporter, partial [Aureobasidium melanogenum]
AIAVENWGWFIEFTPAFIGSGMLVGLNVALSFFGGSVLAWGIIGPALVHNGVAFGAQSYPDDPKWDKVVSFYSLNHKYANKDTPSPRYWLLWPGVLAMIVISFTELFLQWKVFFIMFKAMGRGAAKGFNAMTNKAGISGATINVTDQKEEDVIKDSAADHELVKIWMWGPILILSIIACCIVLGVQYDMPVGMSLLSVFLAFFFAILAVQCAGVTDVTPLTAASKASQLVLGGATKGEHWATEHAQRLNLIGGSLASIGAGQASDLVGDFRVGYLLRTSPFQQWVAQGLGTIVACVLAPAMFMLFSKAYPCIIDIEADKCPFAAPSVGAWRAVAVAVTDPTFPVPKTSGYFAIAFAIFGGAMVVIRHY